MVIPTILFQSFALADDLNSESTILFPTYAIKKSVTSHEIQNYSGEVLALGIDEAGNLVLEGLEQISDGMISAINKLRGKLCSNIKDSDIKLTILIGAEGKLIVGASGQAGMEVAFHCK
jgi:hypothetical protein